MDEKHGSKFINRNFQHWLFENTAPYKLPEAGKEGYIEHPDGKVFSVLSNETVVLEEKNSEKDDDQKWLRSRGDANDWFMLTNPKSGKVLTAEFSSKLTIEGNSILCSVQMCIFILGRIISCLLKNE